MIAKTRNLFIIILVNFFFLPTLSLAVCPNLEGLYQKRKELLKKYEREMDTDRQKAGTYWSQIQTIDKRYEAVIYKLFFEYEQKEFVLFKKCCEGPQSDKYLFFVCKLIRYYLDGDAGLFLKDIPLQKRALDDLWEINNIVKEYYKKPHPRLFDKGSFTVHFVDAIYGLAANGNAIAINKYLGINQFVDGSMAEYMADRILSLFENHPNTISNNWKVIRKYKSTIGFGTTDYKYKADAIIQKYRDLFEKKKTDPSVSEEILEFLKEKGE